MREFKSIARYNMRGREVITVALDQQEDRDGLLAKLQAEGGVRIDGIEYQVDGFESFAIASLRKGMEIGLRIAHSAPDAQAD